MALLVTPIQKRPAVVLMATVAFLLACGLLLPAASAFAGQSSPEKTVQEMTREEHPGTEAEGGSAGYTVYRFDTRDIIDAQTSHSSATILDSAVPLASASTMGDNARTRSATGSIFNAVIAGIAAVSMLIMLGTLAFRKSNNFRVITVRTIAVAFGLVIVSSWSLLDRLEVPSKLYNESSVLIAVLFAAYGIITVFSIVYELVLNRRSAAKAKQD